MNKFVELLEANAHSQIFKVKYFSCPVGGLDYSMLKTKEGLDTLYRAVLMLYDYVACDENVQVHGLVAISDYTNISIDILKVWHPENKKKLMGYFQVRCTMT